MVLPLTNPTKSYWIEAAESPLRDFRSSEELPQETDVVIIGSGYAGAATAYWMHKYTENADVKPQMVMLEARNICGAATGRNGGQLRPHLYSRYVRWKARFGADVAMELIRHEEAHLTAFKELAEAEGFTEEVCLRFGETFDASMTEEAWARLKSNYDAMREDQGEDNEIFRSLRVIEDAKEAEEFSQMKGALKCIVHPTGQIWPYKFVHALLRIVLATGRLNLQAHTPATSISERDADGWITVSTARGNIKARSVVHATNRWASHLLPEFKNIILPDRTTICAIKAPEGFIKHTGSQHFDAMVNNYHLQLPPPYNTIILGGGRQVLVHQPQACLPSDEEDKQIAGMPEFFQTWPARDIVGWPGPDPAEYGKDTHEGGVWTGVQTTTTDAFPFVGPVPGREGQFMAAGFNGHGMPRILLSAAHITPLVLESLNFKYTAPSLVANYPPLPAPFHATPARVEKLVKTAEADVVAEVEGYTKGCENSQGKPFCAPWRAYADM